MRRLLILCGFLGFIGNLYADDNTFASNTFSPDTKTVTLSTTPASPTRIFTKDSFIQANWLIISSSFSIYFSTQNATISTSAVNGNFSIRNPLNGTSSPLIWTPDGPGSVFNGQLFAISQPIETPAVIGVFRSK